MDYRTPHCVFGVNRMAQWRCYFVPTGDHMFILGLVKKKKFNQLIKRNKPAREKDMAL